METKPQTYLPSSAGLQAGSASRTLSLQFTGSGSEYARIWIVNTLLTLVSLSLYWPFAKARRLAYFYSNTLVDGHPLAFHGNPWRMFWGYLIFIFVLTVSSLIDYFLPAFRIFGTLLFALVWPMLWCWSLQFRLRNTSWRGVRFAFEGDVKGSYMVWLPFLTIGLAILPAPWLFLRIKRYQHGGYSYAYERAEMTLPVSQIYRLALWLLVPVFIFLLGIRISTEVIVLLLFLVVASLSLFIVFSIITTKYQNLLWSNTRSQSLQFHSDLRTWSYLRLVIKNWFLIILTFGLYWPYATVNKTRMRLEAVSITLLHGSVDDWVAQIPSTSGNALGDTAGDIVGVDIGL